MKVREEESPLEKVVNISLGIRDSKSKIVDMKVEYEVKITEFKMRLQPIMLAKVHEKMENYL